jgi:hypothetical protein
VRSELPSTPRFDSELETILRGEAARTRRRSRPVPTSALRRLRSVSTTAAHAGAAVALSATLLLLSPGTLDREAQLPPIAEPPRSGYLAQYGAPAVSDVESTVARAREAGFEVDVITTFVADRAAHGEILVIRHVNEPVPRVPVTQTARGLLLIVVGLAVGDAGTIAD